jgi:hypothetical protein
MDQHRVIGPDHAEEYAGPAPPELVGHEARILQRLPGQLQHEPLLRVHLDRLPRRDPEEQRIEPIYLVEEPAPAGVHLARRGEVGVEQRVGVPPITRRFRDRRRPIPKQPPEGVRGRGPGKATGHPDDGDRLVLRLRRERRVHGRCRLIGAAGQVTRHGIRSRMLPDQEGRQGAPQRLRQPGQEVRRTQRVEPVTAEPLAGIDAPRIDAQQLAETRDNQVPDLFFRTFRTRGHPRTVEDGPAHHATSSPARHLSTIALPGSCLSTVR